MLHLGGRLRSRGVGVGLAAPDIGGSVHAISLL
jgi:hypothetical protein